MPTEIAMSPNSSKNRVVIDTTDGTKFVPKQARHMQMPVDIPEGKLAYGHGGRNVKSQMVHTTQDNAGPPALSNKNRSLGLPMQEKSDPISSFRGDQASARRNTGT